MPQKKSLATAMAAALCIPAAAFAQAAAEPAPEVKKVESLQVTAKRLEEALNRLSTDRGSTIYRFEPKDIEALPLGESTPLNQLILQVPGVVQDSFGQLHMRGDHSNLQYRVNGVVIPEAISGFGQSLETRFADRISIFTGALPAQYGYRTAGIVDIQTKGTGFDNGGGIGFFGGGHSHCQEEAAGDGWRGKHTDYLAGSC